MGDAAENQIQRREPTALDRTVGSSNDPRMITKRLRYAQEQFHLVSPATTVGALPEGCAVATSSVQIDAENETYDVGGGGKGLSKSALDRIAAAAGVSWDPHLSGRLDDGSDPHYCAWKAVGHVRHLDGSSIDLVATKEMDLRDGSAQVEALWERYRSQKQAFDIGNRRKPPTDPTGQIREMRLHIVSHAETKARLRAVRSLGIRTSYKEQELQKPFVVARLMWTGQTDDPELRHKFALNQQAAMMGGVQALYGGGAPAQQPPQPQAPQAPQGHAPPPLSESTADPDDMPPAEDERAINTTGEASLPSNAGAHAAPTDIDTSQFKIPGGREKNTALPDASIGTLKWWSGTLRNNIDNNKSRSPGRDEKLVAAINAEIAKREGGGEAQEQPGDEPPPPEDDDAAANDDGELF